MVLNSSEYFGEHFVHDLPTAVYEFEGFRLDASGRRLLGRDGKNIPIPAKAFDTLVFLIRHAGQLVEKDRILSAVWTDSFVEENNLNQHISTLRKVFGERRNENRFIATVPGHGYKFVAEVREISDEVGAPRDEAIDSSTQSAAALPRKLVGRYALAVVIGTVILTLACLYLWDRYSDLAGSENSIETLAVLPFKPLTADDANEELQLGMADSLITKLSNGTEMVVRPLSTVRKFSSIDQDPVETARGLGVAAVLDGTIQTAGDRIRISTRLIRVHDGKQLWAGQFDENFTDIFSVQDSITERVAAVLKANLSKHKSGETKNVAAYQLYIKGRYHLLKITKPETDKAIQAFDQAIANDPTYALAYTGLADAYRVLSLSGEMAPKEYLPKAKAAAQRAIEIDDSLADAHAVLGFVIFWYDWNWSAAEREFKRAIDLDPNNADAHIYYANLLSNLGHHREALAEAKRAVELDPLNFRIAALRAQFLLHGGMTDEALAELQKTFEMDSNYWLAHIYASSAYIEKQDFERAVGEAEKARDLYESARSTSFLGFALARAGRKADALNEVNKLVALSKHTYVSPYNIALIYVGLNDYDRALWWLEKGLELRDPRMTFLRAEPKWSDLRGDDRFIRIINKIAFPQ